MSKRIVTVTEDEYFPFYSMDDDGGARSCIDPRYEITEDEYWQIRGAMQQFEKAQKMMKRITARASLPPKEREIRGCCGSCSAFVAVNQHGLCLNCQRTKNEETLKINAEGSN